MFKRKVKTIYKHTTPWDDWVTLECDMTFKSVLRMVSNGSSCNIRLIDESTLAVDTGGDCSVNFYEPKSLLDRIERDIISASSIVNVKTDKRDRLRKYIKENNETL